MREIKFRARKITGEWAYFTINDILRHVIINWLYEYLAIDKYQYTGLKDKNRVEIYEGDIIKIHPEGDLREIIYSIDRACFIADEKNSGHNELDPTMWNIYAEVIGNIYDNPELLNLNN